MSLLDERLYTDSDTEEIVEELITYASFNNVYEHQLLFPGQPFNYIHNPVPEQIMRNSIMYSFKDYLVIAGNTLKAQSIFIAKRMPHIRNYLNAVGIKHSFCYFKPADFLETEIAVRTIKNGSIEAAMRSIVNDDNKELCNPFNAFYRISLIIDNPTPGFIEDMDKLHNITRNDIPIGPATITLLPTDNEHRRINEIIRLIHKHF